MSEELKPCPFCGSTDVRRQWLFSMRAIQCHDCGAYGPMKEGDEEVIDAWNLRSEPAGKETK